jgi:hypothetical protein
LGSEAAIVLAFALPVLLNVSNVTAEPLLLTVTAPGGGGVGVAGGGVGVAGGGVGVAGGAVELGGVGVVIGEVGGVAPPPVPPPPQPAANALIATTAARRIGKVRIVTAPRT